MPDPEIIIAGAGSAGCLLASLLASQGKSVTLIEPPTNAVSPNTSAGNDRTRPARWLNLLGGGDDWNFATGKVEALAGRSLRWPRGRGLGGCGRINAMIWFPPTAEDLREFAEVSDWRLADLHQSLRKVESIVKTEPPRWLSTSSQRFLEAADTFPEFRPMIYRRVNHLGRRWNPAELLDGSAVHLVRAGVDRVLFDGARAIGVRLMDGQSVVCQQEVILCCGAIGTPLILMRSGIGPPDVLAGCNIDVRVDAPKLGANLHDHLIMPVIFGIDRLQRFSTNSPMRDITRWQTMGCGPLSSNLAECGGLSADGRIQIHVTPTHYLTFPGQDAAAAMTIAVNATKPASRGRISIRSDDPTVAPVIAPNYLADQSDLRTTLDGIALARELAQQPSLSQWTTGELLPGVKRNEDQAIARSIRRFAQTLYHPVGTCAVGDVVDRSLNVQGVSGLRVVDASVLKMVTTGNPNAMVMTVAAAAFHSLS